MLEEKSYARRKLPTSSSDTRSSFVFKVASAAVVVSVFTILFYTNGKNISTTTYRSPVHHNNGAEAIWNTLLPSFTRNIIWTPCYTKHQCARIMLPLDYGETTGPQAGVALVKLPAQDVKHYRGPVLINPGGPGASGVDMVALYGDLVRSLLGPEYDIIGFDPRGVARTTPQVIIFDDKAEGYSWALSELADPPVNTTADALSRLVARRKIYSALVDERAANASLHVSTGNVARDMLEITKALGYDQLQYWGFSYGSVLGATFAAMFPDNVGRIVIDGVVHIEHWYKNIWTSYLVDTDKEMLLFCEACVKAGPDRCPLYESTAEQVLARINNLLNKLKMSPIAVSRASSASKYGILDYKFVKFAIMRMLYGPYHGVAPAIARGLASAEKGDGLPLYESLPLVAPFSCECLSPAPPPSDPIAATIAITCVDREVVGDSIEEFQADWNRIANISSFADMLPGRPTCAGWKTRPKGRFAGPFIANTSHPILLIGNVADPITPLASAHAVAKGFNGSVVLTQNSAGHSSLAATSLCTLDALREYFREGVLPAAGTVCEVMEGIFDTEAERVVADGGLTPHERDIVGSWRRLREVLQPRLL